MDGLDKSEKEQDQVQDLYLIQEIKNGNPEAIHEFVSSKYAFAYLAACLLSPDTLHSKNIVSQVFSDLVVSLNKLGDEKSLNEAIIKEISKNSIYLWSQLDTDDPIKIYLKSQLVNVRCILILQVSEILSDTEIKNYYQISDNEHAQLVDQAILELEELGISYNDFRLYINSKIPDKTEIYQAEISQVATQCINLHAENNRKKRIRIISLEVGWVVLGIIILVAGFQFMNGLPVLGDALPSVTASPETLVPASTEPAVSLTKTPQPWEFTQANGRSSSPDISSDGRYITFTSEANNFGVIDTNQLPDVFLHDRIQQKIELISLSTDGGSGNGASGGASVSADGSFIVFTSWATDLTAQETTRCNTETGIDRPCANVYMFDRGTGELSLISQSGGMSANGDSGVNPPGIYPKEMTEISDDGNVIAFHSRAENLGADPLYGGLFIYLRETGELKRIDRTPDGEPVDGSSFWPSLSADGRYLAFATLASNLVTDDLNNAPDIYIYDQQEDILVRITTGPLGTGANGSSLMPSLSDDGGWLVFRSEASDLVESDYNNTADIFLHDLRNGVTQLISFNPSGNSASQASTSPSISGDGEYVAFISLADDLAGQAFSGTWNVYLYSQVTQSNELITVGFDKFPAAGPSAESKLNKDGIQLVFSSAADNLVANDVNLLEDIFLTQSGSSRIRRINIPNR